MNNLEFSSRGFLPCFFGTKDNQGRDGDRRSAL